MYQQFVGPYGIRYDLLYGWTVTKNGDDVSEEEARLALFLFVD